MSNKIKLTINDFDLFIDSIKSVSKIVESAKLSFSENGFEINCANGRLTRCNLDSNAVTAEKKVDVSIEKLGMFLKILTSIKEIHEGDYSNLSFSIDLPKIIVESKKFKTKFQTQDEAVISKWCDKKLTANIEPEFEFTTSSDLIKKLNCHSFIFRDIKDIKIYLETKDDMEKNAIYATIGNKETEINNEITLKFGLVTFGKLDPSRHIILDLEHINFFNTVQSQAISIFLPKSYNMLVYKTKLTGKNNTYCNLNIYNALLKG